MVGGESRQRRCQAPICTHGQVGRARWQYPPPLPLGLPSLLPDILLVWQDVSLEGKAALPCHLQQGGLRVQRGCSKPGVSALPVPAAVDQG